MNNRGKFTQLIFLIHSDKTKYYKVKKISVTEYIYIVWGHDFLLKTIRKKSQIN